MTDKQKFIYHIVKDFSILRCERIVNLVYCSRRLAVSIYGIFYFLNLVHLGFAMLSFCLEKSIPLIYVSTFYFWHSLFRTSHCNINHFVSMVFRIVEIEVFMFYLLINFFMCRKLDIRELLHPNTFASITD